MTNGKKLRMLDMISRTVEGSGYSVQVWKEGEAAWYDFKIFAGENDENTQAEEIADGYIKGDGCAEFNSNAHFCSSQDFFKLMEASPKTSSN